jgi:hypothetical protein
VLETERSAAGDGRAGGARRKLPKRWEIAILRAVRPRPGGRRSGGEKWAQAPVVGQKAVERGGSRPISRVLSRAIIHLGRTSPCASSDLPGSPCGPQERARRPARFPIWSCSRWGLPCRRVLPPARCALTAPFHPCRPQHWPGRLDRTMPAGPVTNGCVLGGLLSVALSVGSRPPGVTWHLALWSPDFPPRRETQRLPGRLPRGVYREWRGVRGQWDRAEDTGQFSTRH